MLQRRHMASTFDEDGDMCARTVLLASRSAAYVSSGKLAASTPYASLPALSSSRTR